MAINPETQYPGKIAPSTPGYPYGAARNITLPGDGTGTPWEAALVNDLFGFQQALLDSAGVVPSGNPDKVGASQYLSAIFKSSGLVRNDYAALRAVESSQLTDFTTCLVTDTEVAGFFVLDKSDATSLDNGGTVLVDADSGRWKRSITGVVYARWFGSEARIYVDPVGGDDVTNHGFDPGSPFETIQKAADTLRAFNSVLAGDWVIDLAAGTYTEGGNFDQIPVAEELVIEGKQTGIVPTVVVDGTSGTASSGLNFNAMGRVRVKYVDSRNWTTVSGSSGIAFLNGTRGVVDTCRGSGNNFADFNASEDTELVVVGDTQIGSGSRYGIRVYRNSGASIGDGINPVVIDGTTEAGLQVRDGSKCVCANNFTANNCNVGVRMIKDGYVELRNSNITNNADSGIFGDSNSQFDNQTGAITFSGNGVNKKFLGFSVDRSTLNLTGITPVYVPMYNFGTLSGVSPTSTYDMVLDGDRASGLQVLGGGNLNLDANKTERLTLNTGDNSFRVTLNAIESYRLTLTDFKPTDDNVKDLGGASFRWATVYAGTGTINTSDEREKTELLEMDEDERSAALDLKAAIRKFKFHDAVERKGESKARIHFGVGAQTVKTIFESHGLKAEDYALFCYDEWDESVEVIEAVREVDLETGEEVEVEPERTVVYPAGNRYGIRYDELLAFILGAM